MKGRYMSKESAARAYGKSIGVEGRIGGWLYNSRGTAFIHGWFAYADNLLYRGRIVAKEEGGERWYEVINRTT